MEMPEQEIPVIFSQMLQMFPNIPQDIIWRYVQQYASDVEKCAQMLNLQNGKYSGFPSATLDNRKNLNECSKFQISDITQNPGTILNNNNDDIIDSNVCNEQTEHTSYDSHSSYSTSIVSLNITEENVPKDCSRNPSAAINFNEPLILDIVPDDEGISHSWRPSNSDDFLCSDLFVPSPIFETLQLQSKQVDQWNPGYNHVEFQVNPRNTLDEESGRYSMTAQMLYDYPLPDRRNYGKDISSYLHYQKSQMNVIRYEVIKAKIERSSLKEHIENLDKELGEKMQSKSVQDIVDLNKEIEQLRLDCQCLCSEIDNKTEVPILLGDVDERFYEKNKISARNTDVQKATCSNCTNSNEVGNTDVQDELNKWQCPECTFANHPAINVCEMCQLPKSVTRRPSFLPIPSSSCYCHPNENSLPVQS